MIDALAPRLPRGCWWLLPMLVALGVGPATSFGQGSTKTRASSKATAKAKPSADEPGSADETSAAKGRDAKADADKGGDEKSDADEVQDDKGSTIEVFKDRRAEDALKADMRAIGRVGAKDADVKAVRSMASNAANVDRDTVRRFVEGMVYQLTNPTNIRALVDPSLKQNPTSSAARAVKEATGDLLEPIFIARNVGNGAFLNTYGQILLEKLPPLLKGHLVPRIEAMIVLGQLGSPQAIDLYARQLNDPNQTVLVKLWAIRGMDNAAQHGNRDLDAFQAIPAAKAIVDFLQREKDTPWPIQKRALEALGSLRMAADPKAQSKVEMASMAMRFLADPNVRPEVRAAAAWALGMMRGTGSIPQFNYKLVGYNLGNVAADLGERVTDSFDDNRTRSEYYTGVLLAQVYHALYGESAARDSGLLQESKRQAAIAKVADLVRPIVEKSIQLLRSPGGSAKQLRQDLTGQVAALRAYLEKNAPADARLVPGGPEFPLKEAQVANAPGRRAAGAAARGGP